MYAVLFILIAIILVMLAGGTWFYITQFKVLSKESKEFMQVVFEALKDKKITATQREKLVKEFTDVKIVLKRIKDKFILDSDGLGVEIKELYNKIKTNIKKK